MFDAYPFGLLTMVVSLEAIILSVFVLLSQNRQAAKERIRGDIEYEVNIKAEMEVAHLHEKVDLLNANAADTAARVRHLERLIERRPAPEGRRAPAPLDELVRRSAAHHSEDEAEARDVARVLDFVARHPDPFDRRIREGHLTGSAFVVAGDGTRVLLLHHRKLDRWLQPGGHADPGETSGEAVALREVREETGLAAVHLHPAAPRPLDVDVHEIPARPGEPAHAHLDLRYLAVAEGDRARPRGAGSGRPQVVRLGRAGGPPPRSRAAAWPGQSLAVLRGPGRNIGAAMSEPDRPVAGRRGRASPSPCARCSSFTWPPTSRWSWTFPAARSS